MSSCSSSWIVRWGPEGLRVLRPQAFVWPRPLAPSALEPEGEAQRLLGRFLWPALWENVPAEIPDYEHLGIGENVALPPTGPGCQLCRSHTSHSLATFSQPVFPFSSATVLIPPAPPFLPPSSSPFPSRAVCYRKGSLSGLRRIPPLPYLQLHPHPHPYPLISRAASKSRVGSRSGVAWVLSVRKTLEAPCPIPIPLLLPYRPLPPPHTSHSLGWTQRLCSLTFRKGRTH